jgi:methionyl-tRNA formyltransferase
VVEADPAFAVATSDGVVHFLDVQPAGKPRLAAQDWVRGRGVAVGDHLT